MENGNYLKAMHFVSDTAHFHSQVPIPQYCPFCWSLLLLRNAGDVSGSSCMYRGCLTMKLWLYTTLSFTAKTSDPECCGGFWGQVLHQLRKEHPSGQALPGEFSQTLQVDLSPQQSLWGWTTCCQKNTSWWTVSFPWRSLQGTCTGHTTIKGRKLDQKLYREETKFIQENNSMTGMIGRPSFLEGDHKELHRMDFPYC